MLLNLLMDGNPFPIAIVVRGNVRILYAFAGRILVLDSAAALPEISAACHRKEN
jgi:hypothetical protein